MTISSHPIWPRLQPFFRIEECAKDGGHDNPRVRIELDSPPMLLRAEALALRLPCVACSAPVQAIRSRAQSNRSRIAGTQAETNLYYAPCCSLEVNVGCSRTKAAREEYKLIKALIRPDLASPRDLYLTVKEKKAALQELAALHAAGIGFGPATVRLFTWLAGTLS